MSPEKESITAVDILKIDAPVLECELQTPGKEGFPVQKEKAQQEPGLETKSEAQTSIAIAIPPVSPYDTFSGPHKVGILLIVLFSTFLLPLTSSVYLPLLSEVIGRCIVSPYLRFLQYLTVDLNTTQQAVSLTVGLYASSDFECWF